MTMSSFHDDSELKRRKDNSWSTDVTEEESEESFFAEDYDDDDEEMDTVSLMRRSKKKPRRPVVKRTGMKSSAMMCSCQRVCCAFVSLIFLLGLLLPWHHKVATFSSNIIDPGAASEQALSTTNAPLPTRDASNLPWATLPVPITHVIKSRFMQHQPHLKALGWARFYLLRYICFPTMVAQTSQNFYWIMATDPELDADILQATIELLQPYPNFYLVQDNQLGSPHFVGGVDVDRLTDDQFRTGNVPQLRNAMATRDAGPYLETRLDADDGLHHQYIEHIQLEASVMLNNNKADQHDRADWSFWCTRHEMEWHWVGRACAISKDAADFGALLPSGHGKEYCATAGLTFGLANAYAINATQVDGKPVAQRPHINIYDTLKKKEVQCGEDLKGTNCIHLVTRWKYSAIRARTPTSAGMKGVNRQKQDFMQEWDDQRNEMWSLMTNDFQIPREACYTAMQYIQNNLADIAQDALDGQCTSSHSCKHEAKDMLKKLMSWANAGSDGCKPPEDDEDNEKNTENGKKDDENNEKNTDNGKNNNVDNEKKTENGKDNTKTP